MIARHNHIPYMYMKFRIDIVVPYQPATASKYHSPWKWIKCVSYTLAKIYTIWHLLLLLCYSRSLFSYGTFVCLSFLFHSFGFPQSHFVLSSSLVGRCLFAIVCNHILYFYHFIRGCMVDACKYIFIFCFCFCMYTYWNMYIWQKESLISHMKRVKTFSFWPNFCTHWEHELTHAQNPGKDIHE